MVDDGKQDSWRVGIYKLFQYAGGFEFRGRAVKALIQLSEIDGSRQVFAYFTPEEVPTGIQTIKETVIAWFAYDQFFAIVDILRHEKPIYVHFLDTAEGRYLNIATAEEPVGEEES